MAAPVLRKLIHLSVQSKPALPDTVDKPAASYFGQDYVELVKNLDVPKNAITSDSSIEQLFRTEGMWDRAARYETVR